MKHTASKTFCRRLFLATGVSASAVALSASLTGCGNGSNGANGSNESPDSSSLKKVTFALDWTPNTNHTGVYVAKELGYYKEVGLDVDIIQAPENGADPIVAAGQADFGVTFQDSMAAYVTGDDALPVTAIAAIIQHNTSGIVSLKELGITSPAKMEGHTFATWEMPIEQGMLKRVVEADGGDFSKVELVPSTVTDEVSALSTKQVDSIWIYWAWAGEKCELAGLDTNFFDFASIDPTFDYYTPVIIANNDVISRDPETVQAFVDATRRGYEHCIEDPDDAVEILLKAAPELDRDLVKASQYYLADQYQADASKWGQMDQQRWDAFFAWVVEQGIVESIPAGAGMTTQFVE